MVASLLRQIAYLLGMRCERCDISPESRHYEPLAKTWCHLSSDGRAYYECKGGS